MKVGITMEELHVYLIRYHNNGYLCKSIVVAESYEQAEQLLVGQHAEFNVTIAIEEYEEITEKGIALTEMTTV